jgi:hypothetical protein
MDSNLAGLRTASGSLMCVNRDHKTAEIHF